MANKLDEIIHWAAVGDQNTLNMWKEYMFWYLDQWGWNDRAKEDFFAWGEYGFNNNLLHGKCSAEDFFLEMHYCSDRMSLDRLFRCHVRYRQALGDT